MELQFWWVNGRGLASCSCLAQNPKGSGRSHNQSKHAMSYIKKELPNNYIAISHMNNIDSSMSWG